MSTKKKVTAKPNPKPKPAAKPTDGLSEEEHGQAWERGEGIPTALDESEQPEKIEETETEDEDETNS